MLLSRDRTRILNGWLHSSFTHMWLPWRGVANQIRIESEPRLKLMITEYNQANETLFLESDMGTYRADIGSINEVLLVQCSNPVQNLEGIAESYDKETPSPEEGELFSSLKEFFCKYKGQVSHLNHQDAIEDLLLTSWCRVHNAAHLEITCSLCKTALNQALERHSEVLQTHTLRPEDTTFPELPERRPPEQEKYEIIGPAIAMNKVTSPNQTWTLRFDGSKSKRGARAGVDVISPTDETYLASYRL